MRGVGRTRRVVRAEVRGDFMGHPIYLNEAFGMGMGDQMKR